MSKINTTLFDKYRQDQAKIDLYILTCKLLWPTVSIDALDTKAALMLK